MLVKWLREAIDGDGNSEHEEYECLQRPWMRRCLRYKVLGQNLQLDDQHPEQDLSFFIWSEQC